MRKRERLLAVWVSYNIWKILNLESEFFKTSRGLTFYGGLSFSGVWVFRGSAFPRKPGGLSFRDIQCSEFFGGRCFRYTGGVWVFDTPRGSVFSIHSGGLCFLGGLCFRYTQGVWDFGGGLCFRYTQGVRDFWGVCVFDTPRGSEFFGGGLCFQCAQGSEFFGVWELCFRGLSFRNTPNLLCFAYRIK